MSSIVARKPCAAHSTSSRPPARHRHRWRDEATETVRAGKGDTDRCTTFPATRIPPPAASGPGQHLASPGSGAGLAPRSGVTRRHHVAPGVINKALTVAVRRAGLTTAIRAHTLRHACATHLLQRGTDRRTIHHLLGHTAVATTMIATHVVQQGGQGVPSPLDDLGV